MMPPVFELEAVSYAYQDQPALDSVSLTIEKGQHVALLGANGSGKSTLLRLLDALYFPSQGRIRAFGQLLNEAALIDETTAFAFRRRVSLVFQNPDVQLFNPTVFDELAFGPLQLGWQKADIRSAIGEWAERMNIAHLLERAPHRLSGGEKKRVALAASMIIRPEVLLLDEPTAALDPASRGEIIRFLLAARHTDQTIVLATHDLHLVHEVVDSVCVMAEGRLITRGTPAEILHDEQLLLRSHLAHSHWHRHDHDPMHAHAHTHLPGEVS